MGESAGRRDFDDFDIFAAAGGINKAVVEAVAYHHAPHRCVTQQWSALTLIHLANALAVELERPDVVPEHTGLDAAYDTEGNFEARLPVWRSLCRAEMMEYSQ